MRTLDATNRHIGTYGNRRETTKNLIESFLKDKDIESLRMEYNHYCHKFYIIDKNCPELKQYFLEPLNIDKLTSLYLDELRYNDLAFINYIDGQGEYHNVIPQFYFED
jgi:hypothetical protein